MDFISRGIEQISNFIEVGGTVVAILLVMSLIALTLIIYKLVILFTTRIGRSHVLDQILERADTGQDIGTAFEGRKGLMASIAARTWTLRHETGEDARDRAIIDADHQLAKLDSGNRALELIAQIAPLLGLFGTVLGMITAFRALQSAGSVVDPSVLAGGIWVALMTTAAGLAVAMPVSVALSFFEARAEQARRRAELIIEIIFRPSAAKSELVQNAAE